MTGARNLGITTRARRFVFHRSILFIVLLMAGLAIPQPAGSGGLQITGTKWIPMGPAPASGHFQWPGGQTGRVTAIAVSPQNKDEVWIGSANGGVWRSINGGQNWTSMSDDQHPLAVGSIAVTDCHPYPDYCHTIYAGTGENAIRRDTYSGAGLLVGTFDGITVSWIQQLGHNPSPLPYYDFTHGSIFNVVLDPRTSGGSQVIYITLSSGVTASATESTVTAPPPLGGYGIYKSSDNGATWAKKMAGRPTDLEFDPSNPDRLFAGILGAGIFRSVDAGNTWCPLDPGLSQPAGCPGPAVSLPNPLTTLFDHVEIAVAPPASPSGPMHLYATFGQCGDRIADDCQPMVYESTDGNGLQWTERWSGWPLAAFGGASPCPGVYSRYTHALAVRPDGTLLLGGIHLCAMQVQQGNTSWTNSDTNTLGCIPLRVPGETPVCSVHFDHHAIVFAPTDSSRVYDGNDGGFAFSNDGGNSWTPGLGGLSTMEFQGITSAPFTTALFGGLQDNAAAEWIGGKLWHDFDCCGDGGFALMDQFNPGGAVHLYVTSNYEDPNGSQSLDTATFLPIRSQDGQQTEPDWQDPLYFFPRYDKGIDGLDDGTKRLRAFYPPFVEPYYKLFGTQALWANGIFDEDIDQWTAFSPTSPPLSSDPEPEIIGGQDVITAIGEASSNHAHYYLGYYSGKTFWSKNACSTPIPDCTNGCWKCGTRLPGPVTWIAIDPTNEDTAYATVSGFVLPQQPNQPNPYHVYKTEDGGQTWTHQTTPPELDGVPANTIAIDPGPPQVLYLGTDNGIYRNTGTIWSRFSDGLPTVPVYAFAIDSAHQRVVAATHGRGAYLLTNTFEKVYVNGPINKKVLDQPVLGEGFRPNQQCSISVLRQDGTVCASSMVDSLGGTLSTDAQGYLVSSKAGSFAGMPLAWACADGKCLGADASSCTGAANPNSRVEVRCGSQIVTGQAAGAIDGLNPGSGMLTLTNHAGGSLASTSVPSGGSAHEAMSAPLAPGAFQLMPSVQATDDSTRILCAVTVPYTGTDPTTTVLQSAADMVNGDASCQAAGVTAALAGGDLGSVIEDRFESAVRLAIHAPPVTGSALVASVRGLPGQATGLCMDVRGLGSALRDQLQPLRIRLTVSPGGAQGGSLTLTERSALGDCSFTVPTAAGEAGAAIASALDAAFQASGPAGTPPSCPSSANPRDLHAHADSVTTAFASDVVVCSDDAAVGVALAPSEICFSNADCDDRNPCTNDTCNPTTGQCQSAPVPDGQACDDQNPCTTGNTCQAGSCGTPVVCSGGDPCAPNVCDPATGACVSQPKVCDDGNPCTSDACLPASGACSFTPLTGSSCDDGDPCTVGDVCTLPPGDPTPICLGGPKCDDGNTCTSDHCDPATGACVNLPIQCDDGNPCTIDSCQSGGCVATPLPNGTACDDGNLCTTGGTCQTDPFTGLATCTESAVNCDDGNSCTVDSCDPTTGGCQHTPIDLAVVPPPLRFTSQTSFSWPAAGGASFYNSYRGSIPLHGMGSRLPAGPAYDQTCFEYGDANGDGAQVSNDPGTPPVGTAFYYLASEETSCGEGSLGSDSNTTPIPNSSPCSNPAPPVLNIMKTHSGNFLQGQQGATYTLIVSNSGSGPTYGTVTVTDMVPSGLTLVSMAGPGWACPPGDTCTRGDALPPGNAYPPITVTVNVAANASSPQVNQADVSGGGAAFASTSDSTIITVVAPSLSITKTHSGHFYRGETGATYTVSVSNTGNAPTSGTVTVTDNAPVGFTNVSMAGTGWTCPTPGSTCTRSDTLTPGSSYPDITVTVDVATDCPLPSVTNQVTASGGGSATATANDPTTIDYPILLILKSHVGNFVQGQQGAVYTLRIQDQGFGPTVGTVTVTEVTPSGLTLVSMSGTGWTCPVSPGNTCTRSDSLASTAYYPDITVTVNVAPAAPSSIMNEADVVGGASVGTGKAFDPTTIDAGRVVLGITKTHGGDFIQGQQNATYTLTVSNGGNLATSGTVTVTENAPSGLTLVSMAGTGWTCPASPGNTCTRSDALAPGASYPDITVTVNVAVNAPSPLTNQATATGGGDATMHTANDPTNVNPGPPVLSITKTHNGNFSQGQTGAKYTVTVTNVGSQSTLGPVDVDELPPSGLAPVSMAGTGWTCSPVHCNRTDSLPVGSSYPVITVTVNVLAGATSPQVNQVNVNGGGALPATATDSTNIIPAGVPALTITKTHSGNFFQGQTNATYTLTVSNNIGAGTTVGPVNVSEQPPSGLTVVSMAGTGWTCGPTSCTRNTALAPGASYPPITLTVNVLATATSPQVNHAQVSGGGSAPTTTSDSTIIVP